MICKKCGNIMKLIQDYYFCDKCEEVEFKTDIEDPGYATKIPKKDVDNNP